MGVARPVPGTEDDEDLTAPGTSPLDEALDAVQEALAESGEPKEEAE